MEIIAELTHSSKYPAWNYYILSKSLENLIYFETNAAVAKEPLAEFVQTGEGLNLSVSQRKHILSIFKEANGHASEKLNKYVDENKPEQPGIRFLKQVIIFHP